MTSITHCCWLYRSKGPCDVFGPWVRWERGQVGIWEFFRRRRRRRRRRLEILEPGNLGFWEFGDLGTWKSRNFEIWGPGNPEIWGPKMEKIKILKIQIRSAQNVGKVWFSRKKILPILFGSIWGHFFHGPKKSKKYQDFASFPWWANRPYSPGLGHVHVFGLGCQLATSCFG